ncbi:MAG TPA: glutamine-hydrolyzing carbamoyl-phosphate synthase small subunit [Anaerolineae bacterium]|nr:glutamine-hydrolyzing carbamoyl-phosphate synthase small subunit [Anaerolineae bacterium]
MAEALLVLEDGTQWRGVALGAQGTRAAEVVFNTSLTGYQEVLTDPSYYAQIVVMTAAHIGNTGINRADPESARIWLSGFAVREASRIPSNWRAEESLDAYLRAQNVVGISELDTRGLVRHLRTRGVMRGALSSQILDADALLQIARDAPDMNGADLVRYVTCDEPYHWEEAVEEKWYAYATKDGRRLPADEKRISGYGPWSSNSGRFHVVAYDYGIKYNILRLLTARGCRVTIVPAQTSADEVLALKPDGIFLSNGPGDPAAVTYAIQNVRNLLGVKPIFGICLGHQILALALGGDTYKLKFGHRGMNQPVKNLVTGQVEITTHNHGFAVQAASLPKKVEITHLNLNDDCVEGLRVPSLDVLAAQFHPESAGGTHDALGLFDEFVSLMEQRESLIANRVSQP